MNRDSIDFAHERVGRLFRRMFFPTLVGMISMVVLNITDGAFVGHGVGSDALAAVNIVAPLFMLTSGIGLMFGIGGSVVTSIHLAHHKQKAADINMTQALIGGIGVTILVSVLIWAFPYATCRAFGCSERLVPLAWSYMRWIALFAPLNTLGCIGMFFIRMDGSPRFAMVVNLLLAVVNIFLDWLFVFPMGWGLQGAALATGTAVMVASLLVGYYLLAHTSRFHLYRLKTSVKSLRLTIRNLGYQMKLGGSAMLGEATMAAVMIAGNFVFIKYLGEDGVAAFSVGCYCLPIVFMLGNAIVQSVQPIVSYAHGIGDSGRVGEALRVSLSWAVLCGLLSMIFMVAGAPFITRTFMSSDCRAFALCLQGLPLFSVAFFFIVINLVLTGYLQSTEQPTRATILTLLRGFVFVLPAYYLMPRLFGVPGIWLSLPLAEALTVLCAALAMKSRVRALK